MKRIVEEAKNCPICGLYFFRQRNKKGQLENYNQFIKKITCSLRCGMIYRGPTKKSRTIEQIKNYLLENREIDKNGCWLWTKSCFWHGYGQINFNGKKSYVHHVSAHIFLGFKKEKKDQWVLHHCDVKNCFNPDHLYIGTIQDNARDAVKRNRLPRGTRVAQSKITENNVKQIRSFCLKGMAQKIVGNKFGISQSQVGRIVNKQCWGWLL